MAETTIFDSDNYVDSDQARIDYKDVLEYNYRVPVTDLPDEEIYNYLNHVQEIDWDESTSDLCSYMPNDSLIISRGSIGRWDGTRYGFELSNGFDDLLHSDIWKDCGTYRIWDDDGKLYMTGHHHDGSVDIEIKALSEAGEQMIEDWYYEDQDYDLNKIWDDSSLSHEPRYAENILGVVPEGKEKDYEPVSLSNKEMEGYINLDEAFSKSFEDIINKHGGLPVSAEFINSLIEDYRAEKSGDVIRNHISSNLAMFATRHNDHFIVCDNSDGSCLVEEFTSIQAAVAYMDGADPADAYAIDKKVKSKEGIENDSVSLADRVAGAKEVSENIAQDTPEHNIGDIER